MYCFIAETRFSLLILFFFLGRIQFAQAIQVSVSKAVFLAPDTSAGALVPYVELAWDINPATVRWQSKDGAYDSRVLITVEASNDTGIVYQDAYVLASKPVSDQSLIPAQRLLDIKRFYVPYGLIRIKMLVADARAPENRFVYQDSSMVAPAQEPQLSDLQLIDTILIRTDGGGAFVKNERLQIPYCDNFFADGRRHLHYYIEAYLPARSKHPLTIHAEIKKRSGEGIAGLKHIDTLPQKLIQFRDDQFYIGSLTSGNYVLHVSLMDAEQRRIDYRQLFFQVENKQPDKRAKPEQDTTNQDNAVSNVNVINLGKTFVSRFSDAQIRAILKMIYPIADPNERNRIAEFQYKPDDMYARYFILNFWSKRDAANPESAWERYTASVKAVNKLFANTGKPGYETERGITYLAYGPPNERVVAPNEPGALPYEVWMYDYLPRQQGKNVILFYRPGNMVGDYQILHTTLIGGIRNPNWRNLLYPSGKPEQASSRAEEYLQNR